VELMDFGSHDVGCLGRAKVNLQRLSACQRPPPDAKPFGHLRERAMDDQLSRYRQSIDNIDAALIYMLAERFKITKAVGELKARIDLPPADPSREARQVERLRNLAQEADLDPEFSEKFLRFIIDEVIHHHEQVKREAGA
jgi:chorismate mutase